jgi:hypothetical protein
VGGWSSPGTQLKAKLSGSLDPGGLACFGCGLTGLDKSILQLFVASRIGSMPKEGGYPSIVNGILTTP